jgi:hypothetical protein
VVAFPEPDLVAQIAGDANRTIGELRPTALTCAVVERESVWIRSGAIEDGDQLGICSASGSVPSMKTASSMREAIRQPSAVRTSLST